MTAAYLAAPLLIPASLLLAWPAPAVAAAQVPAVLARAAQGRIQTPAQATAPMPALSAPLGLDPAIRTGTLPNGLTYYIRRNGRPEKRASVRLAVKAGSIDEADDQRGLAHVLEHMAFNGTTHFKPGELVQYLESIGMRFGAHLNAYTSYDETVYMIDVPTDRDGVLGRGFEVLADFAGGMTLDPKEIDKERGVVLEEWRGRLGVGSRVQTIQEPVLYGKSRYAERLPIGLPEVLRTFTPRRLAEFYRANYRPERMGVIVVGDIDPAAAEQLIRQYFEGLRGRGPAAPRLVYPIPPHVETRVAVATDREAQGSTVTVINKRPRRETRTAADYRRGLVQSLAHQMLNARLGEIARQADAPFLNASTGEDALGRTLEAFTMSARVNDGGIDAGLAALARELKRVRDFGFGEAELERARKGMLSAYERAYNERDKSENGAYVNELVTLFLEGEPAPGIEVEVRMARSFIPTITAAEAAALARTLVPDEGNRVILTVAPDKSGLAPSTQAGLLAAFRRGSAAPVTAWKDDLAASELLARLPTPGSVRARREIPEIGVTVLTLSNGVEAWLKPTDFKNDQVIFTAYSKGGTALAAPEDYRNAALSTQLVGVSGLGGFTPVDLGKLLAGKTAGASAFMGTNTHGVSGSASPRDLEIALQLMYLNFTAPNHTLEGFELMKRRMRAALANQAQSPGAVFGERVRAVNTMDHYTSRAMKSEEVDGLDAGRMASYYEARFANAADFTVFFVGAFTVDQITPLLTAYVASLPSSGMPTARLGELRLGFPVTVLKETVAKGQEPKSQTVMTFFADPGLDELEIHRVNAATAILETKLRDLLREELGGTYSVSVDFSSTQPQSGYGTTSVQFGSAPENVDKLVAGVLGELAQIKREGPSAEDVQKVKEGEKRDLETSMRQNGYWLNSLQTLHLFGWDPTRIIHRAERTELLTRENIQDALRKYFPTDRYTVMTLVPEGK
ncbi:MAG: insulinase family protein [Vicinamibacterales bacterium]